SWGAPKLLFRDLGDGRCSSGESHTGVCIGFKQGQTLGTIQKMELKITLQRGLKLPPYVFFYELISSYSLAIHNPLSCRWLRSSFLWRMTKPFFELSDSPRFPRAHRVMRHLQPGRDLLQSIAIDQRPEQDLLVERAEHFNLALQKTSTLG